MSLNMLMNHRKRRTLTVPASNGRREACKKPEEGKAEVGGYNHKQNDALVIYSRSRRKK